MPTYTVRLESPNGSQWRERTLNAPDEKAAAKQAERLERNRAAYSLARRAEPTVQYKEHPEGVHARVNLDIFAGSGLSGDDLLEFARREHAVDGSGRAVGPNRFIREHLQAHHQAQPYRVSSVEKTLPNAEAVVWALKQLQENPDAWERALKAIRDEGIPIGAVTGSLFGLTAKGMIAGSASIVWASATVKTALTTSAWTPDQDAHDFFNDVTNEVTGPGYTAGGATITPSAATYDTATDTIRLDGTDASWPSSTVSAAKAAVWNDTAGASTTDPLFGWLDFGGTVSTTSGTFAIQWDPTGIIVYDVT
jgi:hypothetical protein